jgi:hypothetical protein
MSKANFPYHKVNFILSVAGFIGSLGFYYGVLRRVYAQTPEKDRIELLEMKNKKLQEQLKIKAREADTLPVNI